MARAAAGRRRADRRRGPVALDAVRTDLLDAVRDTVQPAHASVWLRDAQ